MMMTAGQDGLPALPSQAIDPLPPDAAPAGGIFFLSVLDFSLHLCYNESNTI